LKQRHRCIPVLKQFGGIDVSNDLIIRHSKRFEGRAGVMALRLQKKRPCISIAYNSKKPNCNVNKKEVLAYLSVILKPGNRTLYLAVKPPFH